MSAQAAFRTKVLFDTNQLLQKANSEEEILSLTASQLMKLLNRSLIVYPEQNGGLGSEQCFSVNEKSAQNIFSAPEERDAANWTFANKKRSGASTDSYPDVQQGVPHWELPVFLFLQDEPVPPATQQILFGLPRCSSRQGWPGRTPVPDGR